MLLNYHIDPAIELYGSITDIAHACAFSNQQHFVGPAILGAWDLAPYGKVKYELGYLFGYTHGTPRKAARWLLEYEVVF